MIPRIVVDEPGRLVAFVKEVFDALGTFTEGRPSELWIGGSLLLVSASGERETIPAFLYVYVPDTDGAFERALARGAIGIEEPRDVPYGDRRAMVRDPWGNTWQIATHGGRFT